MLWTLALVSTGVLGLWLAPRSWWGWVLYTGNEVLWFSYALVTGDRPLTIMAVIWFAVGARNTVVARADKALA